MPFGYASRTPTPTAYDSAKDQDRIVVSTSPQASGSRRVKILAGGKDSVQDRHGGGISPGLADEKLMVVYSVVPHSIYEVTNDGVTTPRYVTHTSPALMGSFDTLSVHGGPAIAFVPQHLSSTGEDYYLGIFHSIERLDGGKTRVYRHFAYRFLSVPPFNITSVSDELPLVFTQESGRSRTARVAFVCGLFVGWDGSTTVSYGSSDIRSRALMLHMHELDAMFTGQILRVEHVISGIKSSPGNTLGMKKGYNDSAV